jgi:hypothetical protein
VEALERAGRTDMPAAAEALELPQAAPAPDSDFYEVTETPSPDGRAVSSVPQADGCGE